MAALILELFSEVLIASSLHFPLKIGAAVPNCQKLSIMLVVGTARISILEKQNVDCMTEKLNIFLSDHEQFASFINNFFSPSITVIFNFNLL